MDKKSNKKISIYLDFNFLEFKQNNNEMLKLILILDIKLSDLKASPIRGCYIKKVI